MPCDSCVDKLAFRLIQNHKKLDLIRAYELADKAVNRFEQRQVSLLFALRLQLSILLGNSSLNLFVQLQHIFLGKLTLAGKPIH